MSVDTTTTVHTSEMSIADQEALLAHLKAEAASVTREFLRPVMEHLVTTNASKPAKSPTSTWVGFSTDRVEITIDGKKYGVSVQVTDVAAVEARKEQKKAGEAAQKVADLQKEIDALKAAAAGVSA